VFDSHSVEAARRSGILETLKGGDTLSQELIHQFDNQWRGNRAHWEDSEHLVDHPWGGNKQFTNQNSPDGVEIGENEAPKRYNTGDKVGKEESADVMKGGSKSFLRLN